MRANSNTCSIECVLAVSWWIRRRYNPSLIPRSDPACHFDTMTQSCNDVLSYPLPNLMVFSSHPPRLPPEFSVISVLRLSPSRLTRLIICNSAAVQSMSQPSDQSPCRISASCYRITVTAPSEERRWLAARCCCGATQGGRFRPCQPNSRPRQSKSSARKAPLVGRRSMVPGRQ